METGQGADSGIFLKPKGVDLFNKISKGGAVAPTAPPAYAPEPYTIAGPSGQDIVYSVHSPDPIQSRDLLDRTRPVARILAVGSKKIFRGAKF